MVVPLRRQERSQEQPNRSCLPIREDSASLRSGTRPPTSSIFAVTTSPPPSSAPPGPRPARPGPGRRRQGNPRIGTIDLSRRMQALINLTVPPRTWSDRRRALPRFPDLDCPVASPSGKVADIAAGPRILPVARMPARTRRCRFGPRTRDGVGPWRRSRSTSPTGPRKS